VNKRGERGVRPWMRWINRLYCRLWQRLPNIEHRLPSGPLILVGNHRSGVDPLLIQASVDRGLCFLMARDYHQAMWYARPIFDACGIIPVMPGGANRHALREALAVLKAGDAICLFPEGGANPDIPMQRLLPGAIRLAQQSGAAVVPFRVDGVWPFDHLNLWIPFLRRGKASIRIGQPIAFPPLPPDKEGLEAGTRIIRKAILDLRWRALGT